MGVTGQSKPSHRRITLWDFMGKTVNWRIFLTVFHKIPPICMKDLEPTGFSKSFWDFMGIAPQS